VLKAKNEVPNPIEKITNSLRISFLEKIERILYKITRVSEPKSTDVKVVRKMKINRSNLLGWR